MSIRQCREAKGISQSELANMVGVVQSAVSWWENGRSYPTAENLLAISKNLDCSVDDLLKQDVDEV